MTINRHFHHFHQYMTVLKYLLKTVPKTVPKTLPKTRPKKFPETLPLEVGITFCQTSRKKSRAIEKLSEPCW